MARAGERTLLVRADKPVPAVRFRAAVIDGEPAGRIEIDRAEGPETQALGAENIVDGHGLAAISLIPDRDTAITFLPVDRPGNPAVMIIGLAVLLGALAWTAWDFLGLGA